MVSTITEEGELSEFLCSTDFSFMNKPSGANVSDPTLGTSNRGRHAWRSSLAAVLAELPSIIVSYPLHCMATVNQLEKNPQRRISLGHLSTKKFKAYLDYNGLLFMIFCTQVSKAIYWSVYYSCLYNVFFSGGAVGLGNSTPTWPISLGFLGRALLSAGSALQASTVAGIVSVFLTNPLWVMFTQLQVHGNIRVATFRSLFRGLGFNLLLVSFPTITQFVFVFVVGSYR